MFDIKLTVSDIYEIISCLKIANVMLDDLDGSNSARLLLADKILKQYQSQAGHPDAQIPDSIYAPDPEDFDEEVSPNAD